MPEVNLQGSVNDLVIKQRDGDPKLHRWKTWEPNTPFAPKLDVSLYLDKYQGNLASKLKRMIEKAGVGSYNEQLSGNNFFGEWTKYNIFDWKEPCIQVLRHKIYQSYVDYCKAIDVPVLDREDILIRGWAVRLEPGEPIGMHSHSLHENTFVSGNMSLDDYPTSTDYWIPLFSLYHGPYECPNKKGNVALFPSWLQHGVANNMTGEVRFSLAFDMFVKDSIEFILKTESQSSDLAQIILKSIPL